MRHSLELAVEEDRTAVRLGIFNGERTVFAARLEAPELDQLIRALALGRAHLADQVAPELDEGARLGDVVEDPNYLIGKNSRQDEALLAFRHPGYGWLGFRLRRPAVEAVVRRLGEWLRGEL